MARGDTTVLDLRKAGLAILLFAGVYAAAFALWIPLGLQRPLWLTPMAVGAQVAAPLFETPNVTRQVSAERLRFRIAGEDPASGRTYRFTIDAHPFSHSVPVIGALAAASLGLSMAARARVLAVALGPLFLVSLFLLICAVENAYFGVRGEGAPSLDRALAPIFRAGTDAAEAFFGQFVAVVVTFGAATMFVLRQGARQASGGPNAPCPCGSGRKRKRCCGAA